MKNLYFKLLTKNWFNCYENDPPLSGNGGEGGGGEGGGDGGEGGGGNPDNPGGTGNNNKGGQDDDKPTLSQKQLNKILAEEKRKYQAQIQKQVQELEGLKKSKGLTEKEKDTLQSRIEELQNSLLSKEQLSEKEKKKLAEEHKRQLDGVSSDRDNWKNLFHRSTIERTIVDEAIKAEAFNPNQVVALLGNSTRLVEVTDGEGNPIPGKFIAKVRLDDVDKEGKPITLDLTIPEAITRLKDRTAEFGNLFKSNLTGGLGSTGGAGKTQDIDPSKMTPEQYRKWRASRPDQQKRKRSE